MGTPEDVEFRDHNPRVNSEETQAMVARAMKSVKDGYAITGDVVDLHLKSQSLLPITVNSASHRLLNYTELTSSAIKNAFSSNLGSFGFDIFQALVVDPLHEFEIGIWKGLYVHLLRLLEAFGKGNLISELDERRVFLISPDIEAHALVSLPSCENLVDIGRYHPLDGAPFENSRRMLLNAREELLETMKTYCRYFQCKSVDSVY
jgi:hypothetical protein